MTCGCAYTRYSVASCSYNIWFSKIFLRQVIQLFFRVFSHNKNGLHAYLTSFTKNNKNKRRKLKETFWLYGWLIWRKRGHIATLFVCFVIIIKIRKYYIVCMNSILQTDKIHKKYLPPHITQCNLLVQYNCNSLSFKSKKYENLAINEYEWMNDTMTLPFITIGIWTLFCK